MDKTNKEAFNPKNQALGLPMPKFAHVSLILAPDRSKLSKRHGATSVSQVIQDCIICISSCVFPFPAVRIDLTKESTNLGFEKNDLLFYSAIEFTFIFFIH